MVVTDKGGETRRRIIDAAAAVFAERGYAGSSLSEIIRASELTKGGFYFHFESKADLALAVIDSMRNEWRLYAIHAAGKHERAVDQIAAIVRALQEWKQSQPGLAAIDRLCSELEDDPTVGSQIEHFAGWFDLIEGLLAQAQAQGDMDPTVDVAAAARFAVCSFVGVDHVSRLRRVDDLIVSVDDYLEFTFRAAGLRA